MQSKSGRNILKPKDNFAWYNTQRFNTVSFITDTGVQVYVTFEATGMTGDGAIKGLYKFIML